MNDCSIAIYMYSVYLTATKHADIHIAIPTILKEPTVAEDIEYLWLNVIVITLWL